MKVLIVEDSVSVSEILKVILESDPSIEVAGVVTSGEDAIDFVAANKVDVITMDFNLYGMDGIKATKYIMSKTPTPIIIISSAFNSKNSQDVFRAVEAGALSVMDKPPGLGTPEFNKYSKELIRLVKVVAGVKVIRRRKTKIYEPEFIQKNITKIGDITKIKLIAIGASTGGPQAIRDVLKKLPQNFPLPIVIVQHMTRGFTKPMIDWLLGETKIKLKLAEDNELLLPGTAYFAPDDTHLTISKEMKTKLIDAPPMHSAKPSVSKLFESLKYSLTPYVVGILLTGMGKDGSLELKELKDAGAVTIAQDEDSCVVFGMPKEAINLGGATHILNLEEIGEFLTKLGEQYGGKNLHS